MQQLGPQPGFSGKSLFTIALFVWKNKREGGGALRKVIVLGDGVSEGWTLDRTDALSLLAELGADGAAIAAPSLSVHIRLVVYLFALAQADACL